LPEHNKTGDDDAKLDGDKTTVFHSGALSALADFTASLKREQDHKLHSFLQSKEGV
jgi:hypothetical protein